MHAKTLERLPARILGTARRLGLFDKMKVRKIARWITEAGLKLAGALATSFTVARQLDQGSKSVHHFLVLSTAILLVLITQEGIREPGCAEKTLKDSIPETGYMPLNSANSFRFLT